VAQTISVPFNDVGALEALFAERGSEIACFMLEPIAGNMGFVAPDPDYLERAREITREYGALLVFDEVITGFRAAYGGAQERFGITPDLTALGKIIGGGMPVGAVGGRQEIMSLLAPSGPVYQAGTLSGNPITMAAGAATLQELSKPGVYEALEESGNYFFGHLAEIAARTLGGGSGTAAGNNGAGGAGSGASESSSGAAGGARGGSAAGEGATGSHAGGAGSGAGPAAGGAGGGTCLNYAGSFGTLFFTEGPVRDYAGAKASDTQKHADFFNGMLRRGVYVPPAQFECTFISTAHTREHLDAALQAAEDTLKEMAS
jgi:glutamate-1-semialdehyde 2,1-aminomutase